MKSHIKIIAGSRLYGTFRSNSSDVDYREVVEPDLIDVVLQKKNKTHVVESSDTKKKAGESDTVRIPLAMFINQALNCEPGALEFLYAPVRECSPLFKTLRENRSAFLSDALPGMKGAFFSGLKSARKVAEKNQGVFPITFLKSLSHTVRLGHQIIELQTKNRLVFPFDQELIRLIKGIKYAEKPLNSTNIIRHLESVGLTIDTKCRLPKQPDYEKVHNIILQYYRDSFNKCI